MENEILEPDLFGEIEHKCSFLDCTRPSAGLVPAHSTDTAEGYVMVHRCTLHDTGLFVCPICGRAKQLGSARTLGTGEQICYNCFTMRADICMDSQSRKWYRRCDLDEVETASGPRYILKGTNMEAWQVSDHSSLPIPPDDVCEYMDERYSSSEFNELFIECDRCGCTERRSESAHVPGYGYYCSRCAENYTTECEECGVIIPDDASYTYRDQTLCRDCYDNVRPNLHEYNYRPSPIFRHYYNGAAHNSSYAIRRKMYFGLELEAENLDDVAEAIEDISDIDNGIFYCKRDGSLEDGCSLEAVSHPTTFRYWRDNPSIIKDFCKAVKFADCDSEDSSCGMHIHISRDSVSMLDIYKMIYFCKENAEFIFKISNRHAHGDLNRWADPKFFGYVPTIDRIRCGFPDRYCAINTRNSKTIEFRIFKGAQTPEMIYANIEFVHALTSWIKQMPVARIKDGVTAPEFRQFVYDNAKTYKNLLQNLISKDYTFAERRNRECVS